MIKAVIFDMDGTLVDSRDAVLGAFKHVAAIMGTVYNDEFIKASVGLRLEDTYKRFAPGKNPDELAAEHRKWQHEHKELFKTYDGFKELITALRKQGLKIGVYTSAVRTRTELVKDVLQLQDSFDAMICGDEVTNSKPHQEGVERVAKMLGVELGEVVFVGDAEHDILSGKNAGVITIGITHGFGTKEALKRAGADFIVNNLQELQQTIDRLGLDNE